MSYDLWLTMDAGGAEPRCVEDVGNYTSNVSGIWAEALGIPLASLDQTLAAHAIPLLEAGIAELSAYPEHYQHLEPANGWGDVDGACDYLQKLLAACRRAPKATIEVSR